MLMQAISYQHPTSKTYLDLLSCPGVQIHGAHEANVHPQVAMDARTLNADEDAQIGTRPAGTSLSTVSTLLVLWQLQKIL